MIKISSWTLRCGRYGLRFAFPTLPPRPSRRHDGTAAGDASLDARRDGKQRLAAAGSRFSRAAAFAGPGLAMALTGCVSYYEPPIPPSAVDPRSMDRPQPNGVAGAWVDGSGIISTFREGRFETRTTDSRQLLAYGTYIESSPSMVEIAMTSLLHRSSSKVNCALVDADQLNCTAQTGARFMLHRQM